MSDIYRWREKETNAFSCNIDPPNRSCDNLVLFTVEACMLGIIDGFEAGYIVSKFDGKTLGCFMRYPGATDTCSWDDHLAASVLNPVFAQDVYRYGENNKWSWNGDKLWRFPIFVPTVRSGAGMNLYPWHTLMAASAYIFNMFETKQETSGKILLWLASKRLKRQSLFLDGIIKLWEYTIKKKYSGGMKEVFGIYFPPQQGENHPFADLPEERYGI